ncbi:MAG: RluA family pseudouridine synthase [Planctomycetes bacterium]|nr:RluA family pseudouridine synthase [Planctomycetota bacterium]
MPVDPAKPFDLTFEVMLSRHRNRLDLFVKAMIPSMSRTKVQVRIAEGRVEVNGSVRPANWRVTAGDRILVRCHIPEEGADAGRRIPLDILYEDDDLIVVNKQPGLLVHPVGRHRHDTLLNALYWRCRDILPEDESVNLANRLDQYTSGIVLATKNVRARRFLQEDFERRAPVKEYFALCRGRPAWDEKEIDLPIGHDASEGDHCRMAVRHDGAGKEARTVCRVKEHFDGGFALVHLFPVTGRQHQLRVHMSAVGHPLLADARYGGGRRLELLRPDGETAGLTRYALHAAGLVFRHPADGREMQFQAPLAADLAEVVSAFRAGARETVAGMLLPGNG